MATPAKIKLSNKASATVALLNQSLAHAIDLKLQAKQAHWNVKGETFIALHELFDKASAEAEAYVDLIAERVAQLGGQSEGTLQAVAKTSKLPAYPVGARDAAEHVRALGGAVAATAEHMRQAIDTADDQGDAVTADIYTEITRGLDKLRWFIESHRQ